MSGEETAVSVFSPSDLSFRQNKPLKFEILTFSPARRNLTVKILYFLGWFCLKDKLTEQKTDTAVSCSDSEGLWKVSGKSQSWFPIQPSKKW